MTFSGTYWGVQNNILLLSYLPNSTSIANAIYTFKKIPFTLIQPLQRKSVRHLRHCTINAAKLCVIRMTKTRANRCHAMTFVKQMSRDARPRRGYANRVTCWDLKRKSACELYSLEGIYPSSEFSVCIRSWDTLRSDKIEHTLENFSFLLVVLRGGSGGKWYRAEKYTYHLSPPPFPLLISIFPRSNVTSSPPWKRLFSGS